MASASEKPAVWDWASTVQGATKAAMSVTEDSYGADLSAVSVVVEKYGSDSAALSLSSGSGVTINDATAGQWDFDIGPITAAQTASLVPGFYDVRLTITDSNGVVIPLTKGSWQILRK